MDGMNGGANTRHTRPLLVAVMVVMALAAGWFAGRCHSGGSAVYGDTVRVEVTDTIRYYEPVARDSVVLRYVTRVLKVAGPAADAAVTAAVEGDTCGIAGNGDGNRCDSIAVEIPITQKKYETDDYRAYVSGYKPNLDSIFVYEKTVTEVVSPAGKPQCTLKERLGFGLAVGAGYGIIHRRADVFVGGAVHFRLWP